MKCWILWAVLTTALWALPGRGQSQAGQLSWEQFVDRCAAVRVLYLGEAHDGVLDHQLQADLVDEISQRRSVTVVAEMFQLLSQPILDQFVAGELDSGQLFEQSEWKKRWGYPRELYQPIWNLCQARRLPLMALRNSTESGKNLNSMGVKGLAPEERVGMASEPYTFGPQPETLQKVFESHAGPVSPAAFERFLKVQAIWEEFMAAQVRKALAQESGMVIVLVGKGHLLHGHGLKARVQREWAHPIDQAVVVVDPKPAEALRTDLSWYGPSKASETP